MASLSETSPFREWAETAFVVAYRETIDGIQFILLTATPEKELSKWADLERFLRTGRNIKWTSSQPKENGQSRAKKSPEEGAGLVVLE